MNLKIEEKLQSELISKIIDEHSSTNKSFFELGLEYFEKAKNKEIEIGSAVDYRKLYSEFAENILLSLHAFNFDNNSKNTKEFKELENKISKDNFTKDQINLYNNIFIVERRNKESEKEKTSSFNILSLVLTLPFLLISLIWSIFVKWPHPSRGEQKLLGLFRLFSWFFIICLLNESGSNVFGISYGYEIDKFLTNLISEGFSKFCFLVLYVFVVFNGMKSLLMLGGFVQGKVFTEPINQSFEDEFPNINSALNFREGVLNMRSTRGKMKELSKTAFITKSNFKTLSDGPNTREGIKFLESTLNMQSTRGKYEYLKNMFGGKK